MMVKQVEDEGKSGIHFQNELSWKQLREEARKENKYIFIDCFATWCGPCKYMDKNVYSNNSVSACVDSHFLSVKVQMDTTSLDSKEIQSWYSDAHAIQQDYKVTSLPTYLFFSPDGKIVHQGSGACNREDFISLVRNACNPDKQYFTLLEKYKSGSADIRLLPYLARMAKNLKEVDVANSVARFYCQNYLFKLSEEELSIKRYIEFVSTFRQVLNSKDKYFDLFYRCGDKVDSIMGVKGLSQSIVDDIITSEEITPVLENAYKNRLDPRWSKMYRGIKAKYGMDHAARNVLSAKVRFYEHEKNWRKHITNFVNQVEQYGVGNSIVDFFLNNDAWYVFQHSNRRYELNKALTWTERAIQISEKPNAAYLDTRANVLYKLGHKEAAIAIDEIAVKIDPDDIEIKENLKKMKKGEPTWLPK